MKTSTAIAALAAVAGAGILVVTLLPKGQGAGGTFTVYIDTVDASSNSPIEGAAIGLGASGGATGSNGSAIFQGVKAGSYTLTAQALGYESVTETVAISESSTSFTVKMVATTGCGTTTCNCNQELDSSTCTCVARTPQSILVPPSQVVNLAFGMWSDCLTGAGYVFAFPGNPQTCPQFWNLPNPIPANQYALTADGQVMDTTGKLLCNTTINISMQVSVPWNANGVAGFLEFIAPSTVTTDGNGNFQYEIYLNLNPTSWGVNLQDCTFISAGGPTVVVNPISYSIPGTSLQAVTELTVDLLVCAGYVLNL